MSQINILIDKNSVMKNDDKITGKICFNIDKNYFPDSNWNDFVIIILNWWINSLLNIYKESQFDLMFMDGPFLVRINIDNKKKINVKLIERRKKEKIIYTCLSDISDLLKAVINTTKELIDYIDNKKWISTDITELKKSFLQLNKFSIEILDDKNL